MITPDEIGQGPRHQRAGRVLAGIVAGIVLLLAGIALGSAHSHGGGAIRPGPAITVFRPGARVTVPPEIITVTAAPSVTPGR